MSEGFKATIKPRATNAARGNSLRSPMSADVGRVLPQRPPTGSRNPLGLARQNFRFSE